jgi:L-cysteine desulfidase
MKNLLKEVLANEVYPAFGCTEPIACAYAAAVAAAKLGEPVESLELLVDPGTYKNGSAVTVPRSDGAKGNLIAAALGAVVARPDAKLEILQLVDDEALAVAVAMCDSGRARLDCLAELTEFRVEVTVYGHEKKHSARCVLAGGHTNIETLEKDARPLLHSRVKPPASEMLPYRAALKAMSMADVLALADSMDDDDRDFLRRGVEMNLAVAEWGYEVNGTAQQIRMMHRDGFLADDIFYRIKLRVASAVDARMNGFSHAVMTSGGSGNQGIVGILTTYLVGREMDVSIERILKSLAVTHLVNGYVKCFIGEISAVCGCAIAAGVASAVAIVYQQRGIDLPRIGLAVGNVIGDLSGLICDGAKPGCAMKAVTAVDTALRSGLMALKGYGLSSDDGLVGRTVENSLSNLGRISSEGMYRVDPTMLHILKDKNEG